MIKIYVAGPISATNQFDFLKNTKKGISVSVSLIKQGYSVFCPFLDYQYLLFSSVSKEQLQKNSLEWLKCSDIVFVLNGWENSEETKREVEIAYILKKPVVFNEDMELLKKITNEIQDKQKIIGSGEAET